MIITQVEQLDRLLEKESVVAIDIETKGTYWFSSDTTLMGIGMYFPNKEEKCYIPLRYWDGVQVQTYPDTSIELRQRLMEVLPKLKLIIHNSIFDYSWLRYKYNCPIDIYWDTRIAWHLLSPELAEELGNGKFKRSHYSLDDGIRIVLQQDSHKEAFEEHIKLKGGNVKHGDHYMADTPVLAEYCENDCYFTYLLYLSQYHMLEDLKSIEFMRELFKYQEVLIDQYKHGVAFDSVKAQKYKERLSKIAEIYKQAIEKECGQEILSIRKNLTYTKANSYKTEKKRNEVLSGELVPFNFNSPKQFTQLLEKIGINITEVTEKGSKKTDKATLKKYEGQHKVINHINRLSEVTTSTEFIEQYQKVIVDDTYHPELDICGTASGRLAGFKPNILAVNRRDKRFMRCFHAREGREFFQWDWCLHPDTELLTKERGWIKMLDLIEQDLVWQIDKDSLVGSWTKPIRLINREYEGDMYTVGNERGSFKVTKNHTMLYTGQYHKSREDKHKLRWVNKVQEGIPTTGCNLIPGSITSDIPNSFFSKKEIWISCMLQADAYFTPYNSYVVQASLDRKREKVKELLGRCGSVKPIREGHTKPVEIWCGIKHNSPLLTEKTLNPELIGDNQLEDFVEALIFWDGNKGNNSWSTTNKELADRIQARLVKSNYGVRMFVKKFEKEEHSTLYILVIKYKCRIRLRKNLDIKKEFYKGKIGCVTVEKGFILIRSNGQTFVTGNCQIEPRVLAHFSQDEELAEMIMKGWDIYLEHLVKIYPEKAELYNREDQSGSKKRLQKERDIIKKAILALNYGTGIDKLALLLGVPRQEAQKIYTGYWNARHKVKSFENRLQMLYSKEGLIRNIIDRPITVSKTKDLLNRFIQSSAHDIHIYTTIDFNQDLKQSGIDAYPILCDIHDEGIYEGLSVDKDRFKSILDSTIVAVNNVFQLSIPLEIDLKTVKDFGGLDK